MLSFKEIKELIDLIAEKNLAGIEIERSGFRLRIEGNRRQNGAGFGPTVYYPPLPDHVPPVPALTVGEPGAEVRERQAARVEEKLHAILSPIVGTFYRSPSPEAPPFISPGDRIEKGRIVCIIEAMKLMNEIESDVSGEVVEVLPQNGQPVEYGEKLVTIRVS
jgi:acetyl-CoA carboxylase biotin carboxyl carrier protein